MDTAFCTEKLESWESEAGRWKFLQRVIYFQPLAPIFQPKIKIMKTTDEIVIIDLEATCWENDRIPAGQKTDIIEIGICELNRTTQEISKKQSIYVIPERSEINKFCTNLTGITPQLIEEKGIYFEEACEKIKDEYHSAQLT